MHIYKTPSTLLLKIHCLQSALLCGIFKKSIPVWFHYLDMISLDEILGILLLASRNILYQESVPYEPKLSGMYFSFAECFCL